MDRIYSRNRIKIPKLKIINYDIKKIKTILKIIVILIIAGVTFQSVSKSIVSIFESLAIERVKHVTTEIMNEEVNNILAKYNYKDLVTVTKNEENNANILKTDVVTINKITSDLPIVIEERFQKIQNEKISIPIGALTGNNYLAGMGPNMDIKIIETGNILTDLKTEFEDARNQPNSI